MSPWVLNMHRVSPTSYFCVKKCWGRSSQANTHTQTHTFWFKRETAPSMTYRNCLNFRNRRLSLTLNTSNEAKQQQPTEIPRKPAWDLAERWGMPLSWHCELLWLAGKQTWKMIIQWTSCHCMKSPGRQSIYRYSPSQTAAFTLDLKQKLVRPATVILQVLSFLVSSNMQHELTLSWCGAPMLPQSPGPHCTV